LFPAAALSEEIEEFPEWLQDASPYICAVTAQEMSDVYRNDVFEVCFSGFIEFCKLGYSIEECNLIGSGILNADNNNYLSRLNLTEIEQNVPATIFASLLRQIEAFQRDVFCAEAPEIDRNECFYFSESERTKRVLELIRLGED
jgi:hypothetical protein